MIGYMKKAVTFILSVIISSGLHAQFDTAAMQAQASANTAASGAGQAAAAQVLPMPGENTLPFSYEWVEPDGSQMRTTYTDNGDGATANGLVEKWQPASGYWFKYSPVQTYDLTSCKEIAASHRFNQRRNQAYSAAYRQAQAYYEQKNQQLSVRREEVDLKRREVQASESFIRAYREANNLDQFD